MITNTYLKNIYDTYDTYFIVNKFGTKEQNTHYEDFKMLNEILRDNKEALNALSYLYYHYDCFYKNEYNKMTDENPFYVIQMELNKLKEE